MARPCDHGTCTALATRIGKFTTNLGEGQTKAACGPEHEEMVDRELRFRGFTPKWEDFTQPANAPRAGDFTPRPAAPSACRFELTPIEEGQPNAT